MSTRLNKHKMCTKGSFIFFNHVHSYMELPMTRSQRSRRRDKGLCRPVDLHDDHFEIKLVAFDELPPLSGATMW